MTNFKKTYVATIGTFIGDGSKLTDVTAVSASYATTASYAMNGGGTTTGSFTGSFTGSLSGTASYALTASYLLGSVTSASYASTASYALNAVSSSYASTASYLNTLSQDLTFNGNLTLNGTASITYLNVYYESASIIYSSGSNIFGDATNDVQTLIGRTIVSGSLEVTGSINATNNLTATEITASSGNIRVNTFFKGFLLPQYGYIGNGFATGFPGANDAHMNWDNGSININVASSGKNINIIRSGAQRILLNSSDAKIYLNANESNGAISMRQQDTNSPTTLYVATDGNFNAIGFPYNSESLAAAALHVRNRSNKNTTIIAEGATTGSTKFTFQAIDSASNNLFSIRDDGYITLSGSLVMTGSIIGSLSGTSSYSTQALSSSYASTASYAGTGFVLTNATGLPLTTGVTGLLPTANTSLMYAIVEAGGFNLSTSSGVQPAFPTTKDVWTLNASTTYEFEWQIRITKSGTTCTTSISFALGGGASVTSINFIAIGGTGAAGAAGVIFGAVSVGGTQATVTSNTNALITAKGLIRMNDGGTVTPQINFSASPTSPVMTAGSYIKFTPWGTDTTDTQGTVA